MSAGFALDTGEECLEEQLFLPKWVLPWYPKRIPQAVDAPVFRPSVTHCIKSVFFYTEVSRGQWLTSALLRRGTLCSPTASAPDEGGAI